MREIDQFQTLKAMGTEQKQRMCGHSARSSGWVSVRLNCDLVNSAIVLGRRNFHSARTRLHSPKDGQEQVSLLTFVK